VLTRVFGRGSVPRAITAVCVVLYVAALLADPGALTRPRGLFGMLAPSGSALEALGMTGAYALANGRWWTLFTAVYLHANLLHILFNMLWVNQLAPAVEEVYGRARLIVIFTVAGALGFVASALLGNAFSVGASGAVFGLLGALVCFGRQRGGVFGMAVFRQYGQWALVLFALGFLMPGIDNFAHGGGFVGGFLAALLLSSVDRRPEQGIDRLVATGAVALTALSFALAIWTGFAS
jgi:rhomboid protease GluP